MADCTCKFVAPGQVMIQAGCAVHEKQAHYTCDECACTDYRPKSEPIRKMSGFFWANCVCGHVAQAHN